MVLGESVVRPYCPLVPNLDQFTGESVMLDPASE